MREPVFVECKGCWKLAVLGFSNREKREAVMDREGNVRAIIDRILPAHDTETCSVCGAVYEFPPLDEKRPSENTQYESVLYRFGPPCWPEGAEENLCLRPKNYKEPSSQW